MEIFDAAATRAAIPMAELLDAVEAAYRDVADGRDRSPLRSHAALEGGDLLVMPGIARWRRRQHAQGRDDHAGQRGPRAADDPRHRAVDRRRDRGVACRVRWGDGHRHAHGGRLGRRLSPPGTARRPRARPHRCRGAGRLAGDGGVRGAADRRGPGLRPRRGAARQLRRGTGRGPRAVGRGARDARRRGDGARGGHRVRGHHVDVAGVRCGMARARHPRQRDRCLSAGDGRAADGSLRARGAGCG